MAHDSVRYPVTMEDIYGLPEISIREEMDMPGNMHQTMVNKITMIDKCNLMQQALDQIRFRAKRIPLLDDDKHADGVQEMTDLFLQAYDLLWKTAMHGIN